jgi:hypothetical protein
MGSGDKAITIGIEEEYLLVDPETRALQARLGFAVARTRVGIAYCFQHVMGTRFLACI